MAVKQSTHRKLKTLVHFSIIRIRFSTLINAGIAYPESNRILIKVRINCSVLLGIYDLNLVNIKILFCE